MLGNRRTWSIVLEVTELVCIFALSKLYYYEKIDFSGGVALLRHPSIGGSATDQT